MTHNTLAQRSPSLYHYTDIHGLFGILDNQVLWATDLRFLNDLSEQKHGEKLLDRAFADCIAQYSSESVPVDGNSAYGMVDALKDIWGTSRQIRGDYEPTAVHYSVSCFSEARDQLSQWRAYAADGYCLEFDTSDLLEHLNFVPQTGTSADHALAADIRPVDYGDTGYGELKELIKTTAQECIPLNKTESHGSYRAGHNMSWALRIAAYAIFLKSDAFTEEREVRALISSGHTITTPGRFGLVPRRSIPIPRNLVKAVMVGPNAYADLQEASLKTYGANHMTMNRKGTGPYRFRVDRSAIPFRR